MNWTENACDVCGGSPVIAATADTEEVEPVQDADGMFWADWRITGVHYYCDRHIPAEVTM